MVHLVHLVELGDGEVEIGGPHGDWSVHQSRLLQELVGVVDLLELFGDGLSAHLALLENLDKFVVLEERFNVWSQVLENLVLCLLEQFDVLEGCLRVLVETFFKVRSFIRHNHR